MALNSNPSPARPDHTKAIVGDQGKEVRQDPDTDRVTMTAVERGEGNIEISGHDLVDDGDFVIPDDTSLSKAPFIGGGTDTTLGVQSDDSNQFSVTFEWGTLDDNDNFQSRFTFDSSDDSRLDGDTSYILNISTVLDRIKITLSDTSNASNNNISGGFNAH